MKRALLASGVALLFGFVAGSSILRPLSMLRESYSSSTKDKITFRPVLKMMKRHAILPWRFTLVPHTTLFTWPLSWRLPFRARAPRAAPSARA